MVEMSLSPCQVKVSVIGAGHVGATFAYALLLSGMPVDVLLVDRDAGRARGEALDLSHALPFRVPATVRAGSIEDCSDSEIVVIGAGPNQAPGETRLDLVDRNALVVREVASAIGTRCPNAILIVATNPVDVMARLAHECSGLPATQVVGSGTILDTARLRHLLGRHFRIDPRSVDAQMVGEHGDSAVPVWSLARAGGLPLDHLAAAAGVPFNQAVRDEIARQVRRSAYEIIAGKGATYFAIASGLVRIVEAIIGDQRSMLTVSNAVRSTEGGAALGGVWLSMPRIIGRDGIILSPAVDLSADENDALAKSADVLRAAWERIH
jgi:L-lactate dehydrogenase